MILDKNDCFACKSIERGKSAVVVFQGLPLVKQWIVRWKRIPVANIWFFVIQPMISLNKSQVEK